jgi:penicillin-binding protein 1A
LKDKPATPFRVPPGIRLVRVDYYSGERAGPGSSKVILEAFKPGTEPSGQQSVIQGVANYGQDAGYGSIIPLGSTGENARDQGGSSIIDSTGAYGNGAPADAGNGGQEVITGEPTEQQPVGQQQMGQQPDQQAGDNQQPAANQPAQQQPTLQAPAVGEVPPQPPAQPSAPTTDSSGGIY